MTWRQLARHGPFRRLWLGDAVSLFGDWFTYVAIGTLAADQGASLLAIAAVLLAHTLPRVLLAPLAGRLADRHDRRTILVVASLLRAAAVLGMLGAALAGSLALVHALHFLRMALGAFIEPAASAALPQLVPGEQVARANALLGATWSVIFAAGVAAGGLVTASIGPAWAFAIDAATFVAAAALLSTLPRLRPEGGARPGDRGALRDAWRYTWREGHVLQAALAKLPLALAGGGAWISLHALADRGGAYALALALGSLHAARAIGTGVGPLLWARVAPLRGTALGVHAGLGLCLAGIVAFTRAEAPAAALVASLVWGVGVGACWVTATTRVQTLTPNQLLGRVAAIELLASTTGQCLGGVAGALLAARLDRGEAAAWLGVGLAIAAWLAIEARVRRVRGGARV